MKGFAYVKMLRLAVSTALAVLAAGCSSKGEITLDKGVGIGAIRSACPAVAVPAETGDITLFDPPQSRLASAIDVTAVLTNVRSTCDDSGTDVITTVTFDVRGRRTNTSAARDVTLPYYIAVTQGGTVVSAKRIGRVGLHFNAGQSRAQTQGQAISYVNRAAATLPQDVRRKLTEKRKAGSEDAAVDPLSRPDVREAVLKASFEALVGFQLTEDQLKYNVTR